MSRGACDSRWAPAAALRLALLLSGCGAGATTVEYTCAPACPPGSSCGPEGCQADAPADLSGYAHAAPDLAGACDPACGGATPHCLAGRCVPCVVDADCAAGEICQALGATTACVAGCHDATTCGGGGCCAGQCVDTASSVDHCGGCGQPCSPPFGVGKCEAGACGLAACLPDHADCNGAPGDGCEVLLVADTQHCGACGTACALPHARAGCARGCYLAACDFGFADCDGAPANGCEVPTLTDRRNCGDCGVICPGVARGQVDCRVGACAIASCDAGYADCDLAYGDGCEVNTSTDAAHCGGCGLACGKGLVCKNGGCTCAMCNFANARSMCVNLACVMGACLAGFADCNADPKDGCEVATDGDPLHCGACNVACGGNTPYCLAGVCSAAPPPEVKLYLQLEGLDGSQLFVDSSMWARKVSGVGNARLTTLEHPAVPGDTASLDPAGGMLSLASDAAFVFTGAFAIEAWIYHGAHGNDVVFASMSPQFNVKSEYALLVSWKDYGGIPDDRLHFYYGTRGQNRTGIYSTTAIPVGAWTQVKVARDDQSTFHIAINGADDVINVYNENGGMPQSSTLGNVALDLRVGGESVSGTSWPGYLDELKVTNYK